MRQVNTIFTVYMLFFFYLTIHPSLSWAGEHNEQAWHKTFHTTCEQDIRKACNDALNYHWRKFLLARWMGPQYTQPVSRKSIQARAEQYGRSCKKGEQKACKKLSADWERIVKIQWDEPNPLPFDASTAKTLAIKYARKACKLGNTSACFVWGSILNDFKKSMPIKFYKEACKTEKLVFCFFVTILEKEPETTKELLPFKPTIHKVCLAPYHERCNDTCSIIKGLACRYAADIEAFENKRTDTFFHYVKLACRFDSATSCVELARLKKDNKKKLALFEQACHITPEYGCFEAADILRKLAMDRDKMLRLYRRACRAKNNDGCWGLAKAHFAAKEISAATKAYKKACDYGNAKACIMQYAGWIFILPDTLLRIVGLVFVFLFLLLFIDKEQKWFRQNILEATPTQVNFNIHVYLAFLLTCICILLHIFPTHEVDYHSTLRLPEVIIFAVIIIGIWKRIGFFFPIIYSVSSILLSNPAQHVASSMWAAKDHIIGGRFALLLMSLQTDILQKVQTPLSIISVLIIVYFMPRLVYWMLTNTEIHKLFIPNLQEEVDLEVNQKRLKISIGSVLYAIPWTLNVKYGEQEYPALYFFKRPLVFTWTYSLGTCLLDEHTELEVITHDKLIVPLIGRYISIKINGERFEKTWLTYKNARKYITQYCLLTTLLLLLLLYLSP